MNAGGYLDSLRPEDRARSYTFDDHRLRARDEPRVRDQMALYIDPDHWRTGVGTMLVRAARERLASRGFQEAILWVLEGNHRAERFCVADGWAAEGSKRSGRAWDARFEEVRYRRSLP